MVVGIASTKKVLIELSELAVDAITLVKHGSIFSALPKLAEIFADAKALVADAPHALPELEDLDQAEAAALAAAAYQAVHAILQAIQA